MTPQTQVQDPPAQRLRSIAINAIQSCPTSWDGAKDVFFRELKKDTGAMWELFAAQRASVCQAYLTEIAQELRGTVPRLPSRESSLGSASPTPSNRIPQGLQLRAGLHQAAPRDSNQVPRGQAGREPQKVVAPRNPAHLSSIKAGMDAVGQVARKSVLDILQVNGKAVGDSTVHAAKQWAKKQGRNVRFVEMLTENLPDDAVIREYRTAEAAQDIFDKACANAE